jgi:protein involved in polysaccharide export with SLBB domain
MKRIFLLFFITFCISFSYPQSELKNQYSLQMSSSISVTIGGDFIITGTFPAIINERVDQFITRMYNQAKEEALKLNNNPSAQSEIIDEINKYSFRDVTLIRTNGDKLNLDLLKFRRTADFSHNPYLRNDDVLVFSPVDLERNFFSVSGAVNNPGKFNFVEGDKLSDAIELSMGIHPSYENVRTAEIYRLSYDGEEINRISVNLNSDFNLQRGDRIVISADETQRKSFSVFVMGEVNSPGEIPVTKNNTTVKEVIERAGGVTQNASLKNAKLYTGNTMKMLLEKQYGIKLNNISRDINTELTDLLVTLERHRMFRMSNVILEDTTYFYLENELRVLNEQSSMNFSEIYESSSDAANYRVKDGDIIVVPKKSTTVYVFGQVANPGHVNFSIGQDYQYYINKAGGVGEHAEKDIRVIKGNTRNWLNPLKQKVEIEEGDYIWVPRDEPKRFHYYAQQAGTYLGIVGSAATIILLLLQFTK